MSDREQRQSHCLRTAYIHHVYSVCAWSRLQRWGGWGWAEEKGDLTLHGDGEEGWNRRGTIPVLPEVLLGVGHEVRLVDVCHRIQLLHMQRAECS